MKQPFHVNLEARVSVAGQVLPVALSFLLKAL